MLYKWFNKCKHKQRALDKLGKVDFDRKTSAGLCKVSLADLLLNTEKAISFKVSC